MEAICIRVNNPRVLSVSGHSSQHALDNASFDYYINNNASKEHLEKQVYDIFLKIYPHPLFD